jgi:hypothetical protein
MEVSADDEGSSWYWSKSGPVWVTALCLAVGFALLRFHLNDDNSGNNNEEMISSEEMRQRREKALQQIEQRTKRPSEETKSTESANNVKAEQPLPLKRRSWDVPLSPDSTVDDSKRANNANYTPSKKEPTKHPTLHERAATKASSSLSSNSEGVSVSSDKKKKLPSLPAYLLLSAALKRVYAPTAVSLPQTEDWAEVEKYLQESHIERKGTSFRELALQYGQLKREISSSVVPELANVLRLLAERIRSQAAGLLQSQAEDSPRDGGYPKTPWVRGSAAHQTNISSAELDLFSAYEADVEPTSQARPEGPVEELLILLEQAQPIDSDLLNNWNELTANHVLQAQLVRISNLFRGPAKDAMAPLTSFQTLVSRSKPILEVLGRAFLGFSSEATTGKEVEASSILQPLLSLAAYTLPLPLAAGAEENVWRLQLQDGIPSFPVGALDRSSGATNSCIKIARCVQGMAHALAILVIRSVMKLSQEHRTAVFDWMLHVASKK